MTSVILELNNISKMFSTDRLDTYAIKEASLQVRQGEFVAISGPSGCGKSTLLSILGLLDVPSAGQYRLGDIDVSRLSFGRRARIRNEQVGFVFQAFNLIPELSALDNVALPLEFRGVKKKERREQALAALKSVGVEHRALHFPAQMSGGQQQRVAIARAIVGRPKILLADEPTGNLDSENGQQVMQVLSDLHQSGSTIVMVTHDMSCAARADRHIVMKDGQIGV